MTAIVAVLNRKSVAIAADSAVTVGNTHKVVNCGNKIFTLSKYEPISVMTYNYASFMGTPWEIIIKEYRKKLSEQKKDTVEQYQKDFIDYLYSENFFVNSKNQENYLSMLLVEFYTANLNVTKNKTNLDTSDPNFYPNFISEVDDCMRNNTNAPKIPGFKYYSLGRFADYAKNVMAKFFASPMEVPILDADKDLFFRSFYQFVKCPIVNSGYTGLVFVGYGEKELFPSMVPIKIMGAFDGLLRYVVDTDLACHIKNDETGPSVYICPFAQIDVTQTIIRGINPNLHEIINQVISNTTGQLMNTIRTEVAKIQGNDAVKNAINALDPDAIVKAVQKQISVEMRQSYTDPLLSTLDMLDKEDLANVAESLISLTSLVRRMQPGEETVGGPVDVAVISKGDGFIWIKRKHYFKPEYNQSFMMNYFKN